ncbi:MAG: lipid A-modifier LpxR family protein, partial [Rhodospirillales bacterium]
GLAGPASLADVSHRVAHSLIGRSSRGWDEITSEPVVILQYEKGGRFVFGSDKIGFEAFPHLGATVGNGYTYGALGTTLRIGSHLRKDSGAPRMRMITNGTNFPTPGSYFVWNLFTGVEGRIMGHNIMIDGNSFKDTSDVESLHWVLDSQLGAELGWGAYRMSVMGVYRTKEFNDQEQDDVFLRAGFSAPL